MFVGIEILQKLGLTYCRGIYLIFLHKKNNVAPAKTEVIYQINVRFSCLDGKQVSFCVLPLTDYTITITTNTLILIHYNYTDYNRLN